MLIEDSPEDAQLLLAALRHGGYAPDCERVETEDALRAALDRRLWDIVLCDYTLPRFDGPSAIRVVRETGHDLPIIVISGVVGEDVAVEALRFGANDYLLKGNLTRLIPAVQRELRDAESRRARKLDEAKRRHAEDALRLSEEHYRVLFERNPIPMWVYDRATWRFLEVNQAAMSHYGYSHAEFLALSVFDLRPPEDVPALLTSTGAEGNQGLLTRGTWRHRKKDGSIIFAEVVTQSISHHGKSARIAQALDITERKLAEEELARIKMAVEFASDFISIVDASGRAVFLSRTHVEFFGYDIEQLNRIGGPGGLFVNQGIAEQADTAAATTGSWMGEAYLRTRSGRTVELFVRVNAVRDAQGQPLAFIGVATDISEMKRAQGTIAEQAALLDQAQDAITVMDLRGAIRYWNKGAERLFGWTAAEVTGRSACEFLCEDCAQDEAMAVLLREGAWSGELTRRTKAGREVLIEGRWTLVRDEFGDPRSVLAIDTDITEKKTLEAQFLRAQRMESIGTLAGGIAHDLNNVLGPIIMSVDLFKLTMTEPRDLELLETVEVSAQRGAEMVRQVLSFARGVEGQRLLLQPGCLLKEVQKIVRETFPKSITVLISVPDDVWNLLGDPTQLHQVLLNLCLNARDAMPGGGRLRLAASNLRIDAQYAAMNPEARPGGYVVLEVADTGSGMPPEVAERIFEPFFTTKEVGQGTGLGLSTSLAIARSHEGFIAVESTQGKGTTFKVHLPANRESAGLAPSGGEAGELPRGAGEWVLVIDDEASIRAITGQTLEAFGYRVITAADGAEGVARYVQQPAEIAAVLTDMMMPVMDGAATIRALTKLNPAVKIIAASGLSAKGAEAEAAGAGVKVFLPKPYTAATLLRTLRDLLRPDV